MYKTDKGAPMILLKAPFEYRNLPAFRVHHLK